MNIFEKLPEALLPWYYVNRRDLPWRVDREPYHIWLSEIMLQQTRVEAVKGYYARFLQALPTVELLASCDDDVLHKLWEGLGYYSRVRNLKKAANVILQEYGGIFPQSHAAVLKLPGIGDYTAGAICSIAFDQPTPAVDGNVLRVVSRLTNDDTPIELPAFKASVRGRLAEIYPAEAGDFTQALMELGATVCGPDKRPDCENCPCKAFCRGQLMGTAEKLPVRLPKKERKVEEKTVFILSCQGRFALHKRENTGLLAGLWEFPNVPGTLTPEQAIRMLESMGVHPADVRRQRALSHIFTHIRWDMRGYYVEVWEEAPGFTWMDAQQVNTQAALPTAFRQFWE